MATLFPAFSMEPICASPAVLMLRRSGVRKPSLPGDSAAITIILPRPPLVVPSAATPDPNMESRRPPASDVSPPASIPTLPSSCILICFFLCELVPLAD
ncbi:unnamed protein product [Urochloa humidicola]